MQVKLDFEELFWYNKMKVNFDCLWILILIIGKNT